MSGGLLASVYQCGVCAKIYRLQMQSIQCFFSHEDHMDFFYTHDGCDDLHDTCSKSIIKLGANRQLVNGIANLSKLAHSLSLFLNEDKRVDTSEIRSDIADCLVSLTEVAITMGNEEQMRQQIILATARLKRKVYEDG